MTAGETITRFDAVIAVDWSAASSPGPICPTKDRVWLAWGLAETKPHTRPHPEYFRTRADCESRLHDLLDTELSGAHTLVGFDFPVGYPTLASGEPVLPRSRKLCAQLAGLIQDEPSGTNNRFEVAAELNRRICTQTAAPTGPFWGHPPGRSYEDLPFRKPTATGVQEWRACERILKDRGVHPQPAWKLAGIGSVGSQSLLGLPAVHRLLQHLGDRGHLWPFDALAANHPSRVVITEIWPTLAGDAIDRVDHPIKDARQVAALRDLLLKTGARLTTPSVAQTEGWIIGA